MVLIMDKPVINTILAKILLIIVIQSLLLAAMIAARQAILSSDTSVILETKPIDPRSLFRGDYVRLNYVINELNVSKLAGDKQFQVNDTVYVLLQASGDFWVAKGVYRQAAETKTSSAGTKPLALIRGVVKRVTKKAMVEGQSTESEVDSMRVSYGIENYFVPEGEGLKLERPQEGDEVTLEIAIHDNGKAAIKALLVNGVRQYEETLL